MGDFRCGLETNGHWPRSYYRIRILKCNAWGDPPREPGLSSLEDVTTENRKLRASGAGPAALNRVRPSTLYIVYGQFLSYGNQGTIGTGSHTTSPYGADMNDDDFPDLTDPVAMAAWRASRPWTEKLWRQWYGSTTHWVVGWLRWAPYRFIRRLDALRGMAHLIGNCTDFNITFRDWPSHGHFQWRVKAQSFLFYGTGRGCTLLQASRRAVKQMKRRDSQFGGRVWY